MESFKKFIESKILLEADPPAPAPGGPPPGGPPGGPPPGGISAPASLGGPPGGLGGPPSGIGGPPPMGSPTGGDSQSGSLKLKAYNIWDVLEKILK